MKSKIVVVGSSNTDMVVKSNHFPQPGETILGGEFITNAGGKGANQAVAAARLGGDVDFICKIGADTFGKEAVLGFEKEGINTKYIFVDETSPSGVALILVDNNAENMIVVAPGSNSKLSAPEVEQVIDQIVVADYILVQLEIPIDTVCFLAEKVKEKGKKIILNPAPACKLPDSIYQNLSIITPNEKEAFLLTGVKIVDIESAKLAAQILHDKGVEEVIITLGSKGALVYSNNIFTHVPAIVVKPVDTTAAGDVFNGALVVALNEGKELVEAAKFACGASAISVTRDGAQCSAPYRNELS